MLILEGQFQAPDRLQAVKVPVVSNAQCSRSYSNIDRNKICAGFPEGGKDACQVLQFHTLLAKRKRIEILFYY